jgi:hypothetical protein
VTPTEIADGIRILGRIVGDQLRARDALLDRARRESVPLV